MVKLHVGCMLVHVDGLQTKLIPTVVLTFCTMSSLVIMNNFECVIGEDVIGARKTGHRRFECVANLVLRLHDMLVVV